MTSEEFGHIAQWLQPQMMRVAMDFFHHREEAEDVVQEVLMRLWLRERTHATAHREELAALAIKATKNLCVSTWRKQKLRQKIPIDHHLAGVSSDERADKALLTTERAQAIDKAISQLPRSEQRLIRMKQNDGLSSDESDLFTADYTEEYDRIVSGWKRRIWWRNTGIAASIALVVSLGFMLRPSANENMAVAYINGTKVSDEQQVLDMMESTMGDLFAHCDAEEELYKLFNPE